VIGVADYVNWGWALVPIPAGKKGPTATGWNLPENAITTLQGAAALTGNVGLAHAYCTPNPTMSLDIDDMALATEWLSKRGVDLDAMLDADDAVQIVSGKPGRAKLLYRLPDGMQPHPMKQIKCPITGDMILELRCASANGLTVQDLLPPSIHPETGKPYVWGGKGNPANLPVLAEKVRLIWTMFSGRANAAATQPASKGGVASPAPVDAATVKALRSALFHLRADDRAVWVKAGLALKALGETARGMWVDWSLTSTKADPLEVSTTWDGFAPTTIDYRFVFAEAQRQGWVNPGQSIPSASVAAATPWPMPQPLPSALRPVKALDPAWLPTSIRDAVVDIADRLQCPADYVAAALLVGAGAIVGNRIGILPKERDTSWEVYPTLWGGIVGSPGTMKTPALQQAMKPLRHIEEQDGVAYVQVAAQYEIDLKRYQKELAAFKVGKTTTIPVEPTEPNRPRLIVNDTTYQALGVILAGNPNGVLIHGDELSGLLQSLDTAGQEAARGFYLSGWGGNGDHRFDRITRGHINLPRYVLSIFGGFQPDKIRHYVLAAQSGSSQNDGLLQRFQLMVWPDLVGAVRLVDRVPDKVALDRMNQVMVGLRGVVGGPTGLPGAVVNQYGSRLLHFDAAAQGAFNAWYVVNETLLRKDALGASKQSHFSKYRSLLPGLALLFHLLEQHQGPVCEGCFLRALDYAAYLKSHAERLYGAVHGHDNAALRALAWKLVAKALSSGFTCRSVYLKGWTDLSDKARVETALERLTELGWLRERLVETGGRKRMEYDVNPLINKGLL
jgi:hypothetical protein